jgi:redox-sensing transcriptional repressor
MINNLPANTVERLSLYRRVLLNYPVQQKPNIHSHQLAHLLKINPAHVRRDLMLIGFTGDIHKGYDIHSLIKSIGEAIDCVHVQKVAFVGIGDLGRAVADYFNRQDAKLKVAATFRINDEPSVQFQDVKCYNISRMKQIMRKEKIELCVLAVPTSFAEDISKVVIDAGVKGILNFTSVHLKVPDSIYIEHYDMISKLEKLAYFTNKDSCPGK